VPIVSELLFQRQSSNEATLEFAQRGWKHDKVLCPWLTEKLETIRESFLKFQSEAYDIQGIHDLGTDIVLRYAPSDDVAGTDRKYVAFQIKSHEDLARSDYLKELRSQFMQAVGEYRDRLDRYFVLLCGDALKFQGKIREISKTMSTHDKAVVVEPRYSHNFFNLNRSKIWSVVDLYFRQDDEVLMEAIKLVSDLPPTHVAIAIAAISGATFGTEGSVIDIDDLLNENFVRAVYDIVPDFNDFDLAEEIYFSGTGKATSTLIEDVDEHELLDQERPLELRRVEDIESMMSSFLVIDGFGSRARVDLEYGRPIQALLVDATVRYGYRGATLCEYVFELLGALDRFGLAMPARDTGRPLI
jgi:hypothetical protein